MLELGQHLARLMQKGLTCRRELHALGVALHEYRAQILLQRLERHAQRRLGDAQALGGAAEVRLFGQDHKVTQQMGFHHDSQSLVKTILDAARHREFASVAHMPRSPTPAVM
ncbi:hypothetical protein SDC9_184354 [bioreactor metagenome]|uniref:Uncharacterized protein n=1 Tax=bioreactor metagenome TaxID=1076179 RepID=A0A645HEP2_9ZZZZ